MSFALQAQLTSRLEASRVLDQAGGDRVDQDLPGLGRALKPGCRVAHVAESLEFAVRLNGGDDLA